MSDIADNADQQVAQFTAFALAHKKPEGPEFTGACAECGEAVPQPRRWCDCDCRDSFEKRIRRTYGNTQ